MTWRVSATGGLTSARWNQGQRFESSRTRLEMPPLRRGFVVSEASASRGRARESERPPARRACFKPRHRLRRTTPFRAAAPLGSVSGTERELGTQRGALARRLAIAIVPPSASTRSVSPVRARSPSRDQPRPRVVADVASSTAVARPGVNLHLRGLSVLCRVGESLGDDVVGPHLGVVGSRLSTAKPSLTGTAARRASAHQRAARPPSDRIAGWSRATARATRRAPPPAPPDARQLSDELLVVDGAIVSALRSASDSDTRRCWIPSWRSRSKRRRTSSDAATSRAREAASLDCCPHSRSRLLERGELLHAFVGVRRQRSWDWTAMAPRDGPRRRSGWQPPT